MATIKAKGTAKTIGEKVGIPIGQAMRENGYSISTSESPKKLTETKGWQELMDQQLPDKDLVGVHKQGLEATKFIPVPIDEVQFDWIKVEHLSHDNKFKILTVAVQNDIIQKYNRIARFFNSFDYYFFTRIMNEFYRKTILLNSH